MSPTQNLVFLGILVDSRAMTLSLPDEKVDKIVTELQNFAQRKRASKRQLESLAGKLVYASQVVHGGRIYLRRMLTFISRLKKPHHKAKLGKEFYKDLYWWLQCVRAFNVKHILSVHQTNHVIRTDACQTGAGFIFNEDWGYVNWLHDFPKAANLHINYMEVLATLLAIKRWAPLFTGGQVIVATDSKVARDILKKGVSHHPLVMEALHNLFLAGNNI